MPNMCLLTQLILQRVWDWKRFENRWKITEISYVVIWKRVDGGKSHLELGKCGNQNCKNSTIQNVQQITSLTNVFFSKKDYLIVFDRRAPYLLPLFHPRDFTTRVNESKHNLKTGKKASRYCRKKQVIKLKWKFSKSFEKKFFLRICVFGFLQSRKWVKASMFNVQLLLMLRFYSSFLLSPNFCEKLWQTLKKLKNVQSLVIF